MSAVCAFTVGAKYCPGNVRIIGAHTDSPCPRLKPNTKATSADPLQVRVRRWRPLVHVLDRDLGVAGRVLVRRGGDGVESKPRMSSSRWTALSCASRASPSTSICH